MPRLNVRVFFLDENEEREGGKPSFDKKKNPLLQTKEFFLQWQNVLHDVLSVVYETKV